MDGIKYYVHAVTPIHVGAGRGLGYIDLPIAREKATNWPYIPGSSIKGVISDYYGADDKSRREREDLRAAFGTSGSDNTSSAGALVFTDADILCMPIRSFYGTFAWITSPFCLMRVMPEAVVPDFPENVKALAAENSALTDNNGKIYLEDLDIDTQESPEAGKIAEEIARAVFENNQKWQKVFAERFALVSDDFFTFLCEAGTEVTAHIKIDDKTGIVAEGALWYEEALPAETILAGRVWCDKVFVDGLTGADLFERFCSGTITLQVGGKASTGKGLAHFVFGEGE